MAQSVDRTHHTGQAAAVDRGERFRQAIQSRARALGYRSDAALAEAAGVSSNTLRNWWHGKGVELGSLLAVADVLDEGICDLLCAWQGRPLTRPESPLGDLAAELRAWRTEDRDRLAQLEAMVAGLAEEALAARGTEGVAMPRARRPTVE